MGTVLDDLGSLLVTAGCGTMTAPAPTIFTGVVPSSPPDITSLLDWRPPDHSPVQVMGGTKPAVEMYNVQTQTRGADRDATLTRAFGVYNALNKYSGVIDGVTYLLVLAGGPPFQLQRDENNLWVFAANFRVIRRPL